MPSYTPGLLNSCKESVCVAGPRLLFADGDQRRTEHVLADAVALGNDAEDAAVGGRVGRGDRRHGLVQERIEQLPVALDALYAEAFQLGEELLPDHLHALQ